MKTKVIVGIVLFAFAFLGHTVIFKVTGARLSAIIQEVKGDSPDKKDESLVKVIERQNKIFERFESENRMLLTIEKYRILYVIAGLLTALMFFSGRFRGHATKE
jgi:hypothetical protein